MKNITFKKIMNYIRYQKDLKNKKVKTLSFPPGIEIQAASFCNSNCQLCPVGLGIKGADKGFLKFEQFKKIIDESKNYLIKIYFGDWGEPFLNPDIFDMIYYAEKNKILTSASTNLHRFINEDDLMKLLDSNLSSLTISLHGITQKTYEKYQPNKDLKTVLKKIDSLIELKKSKKMKKPKINLAFAITKKNQHEIPLIIEYSKKLGVNYTLYTASLNLRFYQGDDKKILNMINNWGQDKYFNFLNNIKFRKKTINELYKTILTEGKMDFTQMDKLQLTGRHFCVDPWRSMVVNWDGTISLCCVDYYKYIAGDTKNESIIDIWNNDKYQNIRKYLRKDLDINDENIPCSKCIRY
jgi:radical SAM protein with 4Fe4S-binding SPASM domain